LFLGQFLEPIKDLKRLNHQYVEVDYQRAREKVFYEIVAKKPKEWRSLNQVSTHLRQAIIISEDALFYQHSGFDLQQIAIVLEESMKEGKFTRGASTISQQLVKNLLLTHDRKLSRKLNEFLLTHFLEKFLNKNKILEIYLNIIEFGHGLYGIGPAAHYYFNKEAQNLSLKESAFLAMLLPNPKKYASSFFQKELTPFAQTVIDEILKKLYDVKRIDENQYLDAKAEILFVPISRPAEESDIDLEESEELLNQSVDEDSL
jgi:monofunctional biosynthetic peptidoglycan transglycosylase